MRITHPLFSKQGPAQPTLLSICDPIQIRTGIKTLEESCVNPLHYGAILYVQRDSNPHLQLQLQIVV